jgi:cell division protein FtsQ
MVKRSNKRKQSAGERVADAKELLRGWASRVGPALLLSAIALGLPYGVFQVYMYAVSSPTFGVKQVTITGASHVTEAELLKRGELALGMNIFDVDEVRAAALIEELPWVASAEVVRELPDTVKVVVREHEPAAVALDGGAWTLLDAGGLPFKQLEPKDPAAALIAQLPLITGLDVGKLADPGEGGGLERARYAEVRQVLELYARMGLDKRAPLGEVHIDPVLGVSLILAEGGAEVRLGWGRWEERLGRLAVVHDALAARGTEAEYILIDQEESLHRIAVGPARAKER